MLRVYWQINDDKLRVDIRWISTPFQAASRGGLGVVSAQDPHAKVVVAHREVCSRLHASQGTYPDGSHGQARPSILPPLLPLRKISRKPASSIPARDLLPCHVRALAFPTTPTLHRSAGRIFSIYSCVRPSSVKLCPFATQMMLQVFDRWLHYQLGTEAGVVPIPPSTLHSGTRPITRFVSIGRV